MSNQKREVANQVTDWSKVVGGFLINLVYDGFFVKLSQLWLSGYTSASRVEFILCSGHSRNLLNLFSFMCQTG